MAEQNPQSPAEQAISPINGLAPPVEHRFKPGQSGNPAGRPANAGLTIREKINEFIANDFTELELREVARKKTTPAAARIAAERILRAMEAGDLADYAEWLVGTKTLMQLREAGLNTELVKKAKIGDKGRELELHDRAGEAMDALIGHTALTVGEMDKNARLDEGKVTDRVAVEPVVLERPVLPSQ